MGGGGYSPQGNLPIGGVRDPNMSRLGARHVRPRSLEPGLGARQVWFQDLTRVKAERSDMSAITLWNLDKEPNKVGWDLAAEDQRLG
jgi:hypothetical protein